MTLKSVTFLLVALAFAGDASGRPDVSAALSSAATINVQQTAATDALLQPYNTGSRTAHKEPHHHYHHGGRLSIVRLLRIIGKVLAPLVGAIIEPVLVNVAKGITWAITYTLATGFDKPPSYEHFVPALHHHGGGGGYEDDQEADGSQDYDSHKPVAYSLNELPRLALQLTSTVLSGDQQGEHAEAVENAEKKLAGMLSQSDAAPPQAQQ